MAMRLQLITEKCGRAHPPQTLKERQFHPLHHEAEGHAIFIAHQLSDLACVAQLPAITFSFLGTSIMMMSSPPIPIREALIRRRVN